MKRKLIYPFLAVCLSFLLAACSEQTAPKEEKTYDVKVEQTTSTRESEAKEANSTPTAHWSYEGDTGPEHWGELTPAYSACANGREQSPINIESSQVKEGTKLKDIQIQYEPTTFSLENNGHTIQAHPTTESNSIIVAKKEYKLAQIHFHTPSEHQYNAQNYAMELHLVHTDKTGKIAVLGVMIQEGKENKTLATLWNVLPKEEAKKAITINEPINLQALLPQDQISFHYNGSLTTPPCTEGVKWIVFEQPIELSKAQIQAFQDIFPDNHRPVQPLNERKIIKN